MKIPDKITSMITTRGGMGQWIRLILGYQFISYTCAFLFPCQPRLLLPSDLLRRGTSRLSPLYFQQGRGYSFVTRRSSNYNNGGLAWDNSNFLDALSQGTASPALHKANEEYTQQAQFNTIRRRSLLAKAFPSLDDDDDDNYNNDNSDSSTDEDLAGGEVSVPQHLIKKPAPIDEDNPMGGQMFRKMLEKAKTGNPALRSSAVSQTQTYQTVSPLNTPAPYPFNTATPAPMQSMAPQNMPMNVPAMETMSTQPNFSQQPQQGFYVDPQQAYYQAQLQAWQQQMMAFAQLSAINPQAAASMTLPPPPPPPPAAMMMGPGYYPGQPSSPQNANMYPPMPAPNNALTMNPSIPVPPQQQQQQQKQQKQAPTDEQGIKAVQEYLPKAQPGRSNRDAYDIANAADVYFAQLKRDSTLRTLAREAGDDTTANKPFADEGVQALKNFFSETLTDQRKEVRGKSNDLFTTSREEMLIPPSEQDFVDEATKQRQMKESGVKYKQMMEQKRKQKTAAYQEKKSTLMKNTDDTLPSLSTFVSEKKPIVNTPPLIESIPVIQREPIVSSSSSSSFMDISLKPTPRTIVSMDPPTTTSSSSSSSSSPSVPVAIIKQEEKNQLTRDGTETTNIKQDTDENRKVIRTLMGLLLKHRGGTGFGAGRLKAPEHVKLQESFAHVLQLLKSEVNVVAESSSSISTQDHLVHGALECIQAVITLYQSAEKDQKHELLGSVRDALTSAVNTLNKAITEKEANQESHVSHAVKETTLEFSEKYEYATTDSLVSISSPEKSNNWDVSMNDEDGNDSTVRLQEIYSKLQLYQGNEKFGLKKVSSNEISSLSDLLSDMRGMLMNELGS